MAEKLAEMTPGSGGAPALCRLHRRRHPEHRERGGDHRDPQEAREGAAGRPDRGGGPRAVRPGEAQQRDDAAGEAAHRVS